MTIWIERGLFGLAILVTLYGMLTATVMILLSLKGKLSMRLIALALLMLCATIGYEGLLMNNWFEAYPGHRFLPLAPSLAVGPSLFYYIKCRLYPGFQFRWKDIKHALPVTLQVAALITLYMQPDHLKDDIWEGFYRYYFHPIENLLFVFTGCLYLFFGWRFIRHALSVRKDPVQILDALRLKRTVKVQFMFLVFYAAYLVDDTIRRLLLMRVQSDLTWVSWFSFSALLGMLIWLSLFAWLYEYWQPRRTRGL